MKRPKAKPNRGGQKVKIDEGLLRKVASLNCSYEEMGWIVGCSRDTLQRRFKDIIEEERAKKYASLRAAQFKYAMRGNASLLIFLGKVYLKQKADHDDTGETINVYINDEHKAEVKKKKESEDSQTEEQGKDV